MIDQSAGAFTFSGATTSSFLNQGVLNITMASGTTFSWPPALNHQGEKRYTNSNVVCLPSNGRCACVCVSFFFFDKGTINVRGGTLSLQGGLNSTAPITIPNDTTLDFNGGTSTINAGTNIQCYGQLSFSAGTINFQ